MEEEGAEEGREWEGAGAVEVGMEEVMITAKVGMEIDTTTKVVGMVIKVDMAIKADMVGDMGIITKVGMVTATKEAMLVVMPTKVLYL
jgi:hypothetical protein